MDRPSLRRALTMWTPKQIWTPIKAVLDTIYTRQADGNQVTQISGAIPLPAGASTEATLALVRAALEAGGDTADAVIAIQAALEASGYSAVRLEAIKVALEAGGDTEAAIQAAVTALNSPAQAGEAAAATAGLALNATLGSPAQAGEAATATAGLATEAKQDKIPGVLKTGSAGTYAGAEIEVTGLTASTRYLLRSLTMQLIGGTGGNTTQPSIGEETGFAQGDMDDRYKMSAAILLGDGRTVDTLVQAIPIWSDSAGKLYIKGAAPVAADSTLFWRVDLDEARTGA
ncbi:MAG: hypothetical protein ABIL09_23215 [Gemmatimonadota bacterium]